MLNSVPIETINVSLIMVIGAVILVAGWAFGFGVFYAKLSEVSLATTKILKEVTKQGERLDNIEKDHVTRKEFGEVKDKVISVVALQGVKHGTGE